jgi:hypothetical protein
MLTAEGEITTYQEPYKGRQSAVLNSSLELRMLEKWNQELFIHFVMEPGEL